MAVLTRSVASLRLSLSLAVLAVRAWTPRQVVAAAVATVGVGVAVGAATVLIPNPVFGREIAPVAWNYPAWALASVLSGMLVATYVRPGARSSGLPAARPIDDQAPAGSDPTQAGSDPTQAGSDPSARAAGARGAGAAPGRHDGPAPETAPTPENTPAPIGASAPGAPSDAPGNPSDDPGNPSDDPDGRRSGRLGLAGAVLAWFAVGCPVCNKLALLALGYTGALTWFAPVQPFLAVGAIALSATALVWRLRGQVACPVTPARAPRAPIGVAP